MQYLSFSNYSPRGTSEDSMNSKKFCGFVKNGSYDVIKLAVLHIKNNDPNNLVADFLNEETTLIPIPRSSPMVDGALWPGKVIADILLEEGFGKEVSTCLKRITSVPKSSLQSDADSRPSVSTHMGSLNVELGINIPEKITLIDDVLTMGRTSIACAKKLKAAFPEAEIRLLTLLRTQSFIPEIENFVDISTSKINYYPDSGKTYRED